MWVKFSCIFDCCTKKNNENNRENQAIIWLKYEAKSQSKRAEEREKAHDMLWIRLKAKNFHHYMLWK